MTVLKDTYSVLKAARGLIENPDHWAKGFAAYDANGNECLAHKEEAVCFCVVGAVLRVTDAMPSLSVPAQTLLDKAIPESFEVDWGSREAPAAQFNDAEATTHADVMALYDRALRKAA